MDLEAWRRENFAKRCMDYAEKYPELCIFWDQTVMNTLLAGSFNRLDGKLKQQLNGPKKVFSQEGILHYCGPEKSWAFTHDLPRDLIDIFFKELDRTAWRNWRPQPRISFALRVARKIKQMVYGF
jgi:lipopolysaccharide biosynthesis glycosyltransferase